MELQKESENEEEEENWLTSSSVSSDTIEMEEISRFNHIENKEVVWGKDNR